MLWLDGVYGGEPAGEGRWRAHGAVKDEDVAALVQRLRDRVLRRLRRLARWPEEGEDLELPGGDEQPLLELGSAAVQGRTALGARAVEGDARPGRGSRWEPFVKAPSPAALQRRH